MVSKEEEKLIQKSKKIWGKKCKDCEYKGELKYTFESEKKYKIVIVECPECSMLLFMGQDGKYRWVLRE